MKWIPLEQVLSADGNRRDAFVVASVRLRHNEVRPLPSEGDEWVIGSVARSEQTGEAIAERPETHALIESAKNAGVASLWKT